VSGSKNKYLFQGQEHQEETGWDSFKWRNHQPDIGRFFNIDPLAEDYVHNSPYAFSENRVTNSIELEGLEAVDLWSRDPNLQGRSSEEVQAYRDGQTTAIKVAAEVGAGFSPLGVAQDVRDLGAAIGEGDKVGMVIGVVAFLPGGDLLKSGRKVANAVDNAGDAAKKVDFVVSPDGTTVPTSQSRMQEGFEKAGLPNKPTESPGTEYTLPDGNRVRTMEPSGDAPRRASFENANGQPVDMDGNTVQPPRGMSRSQRKQYIRERTHVIQD
jgi:RHS repeat-associated protein